ncbi:MAG: Crp/Fnr family transcriptional regulator [Pyrinomonadaceae bacterium]
MHDNIDPHRSNKFLSALPKREHERLLPHLEICDLNFGDILFEPDDLIEHVYFPVSGIVSLISLATGHAKISIGMIGKEGIVGLPVYLGSSRAQRSAVVHGAGKALRMKSVDLLNICELGGVFPSLLNRFTNLFITSLSQILICTRFHGIELRLVCWLLMAQDKLDNDRLQITQGALSCALGVRREAVTKAIGNLQQQRLIDYNRGTLEVVDRSRLEAAACPCYAVVKAAEKEYINQFA